MSTTCDRVDRQLSEYRDGELGRLYSWRIDAHLRRCCRCAAAAGELDALDARFRNALHTPESPDYLTAAVMRRLPAMPPARRRRWNSARWLVGAGCAVLQAVSLWGAYRAGSLRAELRLRSSAPASRAGLLRPAPAAARPTPERPRPRARATAALLSAR